MPRSCKILFLVHLPPPIHGVSMICKQVVDAEFDAFWIKKSIIKINLSRTIKELQGFRFRKLFRFIWILIKLAYNMIVFRPEYVYFSIMPVGKGFLKDSILVFFIKLFKCKLIYHLHNKGIHKYSKKGVFHFLYMQVFKNSHVIHLSRDLLVNEFELLSPSGMITHILPNGINPIQRYVKNDNKVFQILFFANLIPEKGFITALEALKFLIKDTGQKIKLKISGAPTKKSNGTIREFFYRYPGLKNYVDFSGEAYGEDKAKIFNEASLFIFPSRFAQECMPLVILEAMSVGMPIIASNIGAIPEMITDNKHGHLIPPGDAKVLADKIKFLMQNQTFMEEMGNNARKKYLESFTAQHFNHNLEKVLKKITTF